MQKTMFAPEGTEVQVHSKLEDGRWLATPILETIDDFGDGITCDGPLTIYPVLFEKMPSPKEHPLAKEREAELASLADQIEAAEARLADLEARAAAFKNMPGSDQLALLFDIANKKPVWMVECGYLPRMGRYPEDFQKNTSSYEKDKSVPAISYRAVWNDKIGRRGPMQLVIHTYHDGSGSMTDKVAFFRSEEEAREFVKGILLEKGKAIKTTDHSSNIDSVKKAFADFGLEETEELKVAAEHHRQINLALLEKQITDLQARAEKIKHKENSHE